MLTQPITKVGSELINLEGNADGLYFVRINSNGITKSGKVLRLRGKGVMTARDPRVGDLFATVAVETPVNLTKKQADTLRDLYVSIEKGGTKHSPRAGGWLESVKSFFDRIAS